MWGFLEPAFKNTYIPAVGRFTFSKKLLIFRSVIYSDLISKLSPQNGFRVDNETRTLIRKHQHNQELLKIYKHMNSKQLTIII